MATYRERVEPEVSRAARYLTPERYNPSAPRPWKGMLQYLEKEELAFAPPRIIAEKIYGKGIKTAGSTGAIDQILDFMTRRGHQWSAEVMDNTTFRIHFHNQTNKTGHFFDLPILKGIHFTGQPTAIRDSSRTMHLSDVRRAQFISRPRIFETESGTGEFRRAALLQQIADELVSPKSVLNIGVSKETDYRDIAQAIQKMQRKALEIEVYGGGMKGPLSRTAMAARMREYSRTGSIQDVLHAMTANVFAGPSITSDKFIDQFYGGGSGWPFGPWSKNVRPKMKKVLDPVRGFLQATAGLSAQGIPATPEAIKAEAVLKGQLGLMSLGELVPFGGTGDPSRPMQRWGISQLASTAGRARPMVSTALLEEAKSYVSRITGGTGRWAVESRVALVLDPAFERMVAGSGGGAIITPSLAQELAADITQQADYETRRFTGRVQHRRGRIIEQAGVGSTLITSFGTKHRVGAVTPMTGARMAIGYQALMKGKTPEALREAVVRDVVEQMGPLKFGYKPTRGGKFHQFTDTEMLRRRRMITGLMERMSRIMGGGSELRMNLEGAGTYVEMPQLLVGAEAQFDIDHLNQVNKAIDQYNKRIRESRRRGIDLDLRQVRKGFELDLQGFGKTKMASLMMSASLMSRLESHELVTKAVGAWTQPLTEIPAYAKVMGGLPLQPGGVGSMYQVPGGHARQVMSHIYHPAGVKLRPRDLTNLQLYHTEESKKLARLYEQYIKGWMKEEKQELFRTIGPYFQAPELLGSEVMPKGAVAMRDLPVFATETRNLGKFKLSGADVAGTIFDRAGPLRGRGVNIQLPWDITVGGVQQAGEYLEGVKTRRVYLPGINMYRSVLGEAAARSEELGATAVYLDDLTRAHERLYTAMTAKAPTRDNVEREARKYYDLLSKTLGGKTGFLSYLTTARMAHSGYFGLVPGGVGATPAEQELFAKVGTALPNPYVVQISESSAKELGVHGYFKQKKDVYGRLVAWPAIGPSSETVMQVQMVADDVLGARQLRLSNLLALSMFRDFDADKAGLTFFMSQKAQRYQKAFYEKSVLPRLRDYEKYLEVDPEWQQISDMYEGKLTRLRRTAALVKGGRRSPSELKRARLGYEEVIKVAVSQSEKILKRAEGGIAEKYMTKALTPALTYYLEPLRWYLSQDDLIKRGLITETQASQAGSLLALINQEVSIAKGKAGPLQAAEEFIQILEKPHQGLSDLESSARRMNTLVLEMMGLEPGTGLGRDAKARQEAALAARRKISGWGEWLVPVNPESRHNAVWATLIGAQTRLNEAKVTGSLTPQGRQLLATKAEVMQDFRSTLREFMAVEERELAAKSPIASKIESDINSLLRIGKAVGIDMTDDMAAAQAHRKAGIEAQKALEALNKSTKEGGKAGWGVLEKLTDWWTSANTPFWQRAGVITGAAIMMGAIARQALMPSYGPPSPPMGVYTPPHSARGYEGGGPGGYSGPNETSPTSMGRKPGGIWAYLSSQAGGGPSNYGVSAPSRMPGVIPHFGPRVAMPAMGADLGPGMAMGDSRAMIMAGPPVSTQPTIPPPAEISRSQMAAAEALAFQQREPSPMMEEPAWMRNGPALETGVNVSAVEPFGANQDDLQEVIKEMSGFGSMEVISVRDRMETKFDLRMGEDEDSSFA